MKETATISTRAFTQHRKPIIVAGLLLLLILVSLPTSLAAELMTGETVHIQAGEVVADDLYATGNEILVDGTVQGDLVGAANKIIINGTVEGDLLGGARIIIINGQVQDDVRVGGQAIVVDGQVGDDLVVGGFSLETKPESRVGGDMLVGGFQALLGGALDGDLKGGLEGLEIAGRIDGDVEVEVGGGEGGPSPVEFMRGDPELPPLPTVPIGLTLDDSAVIGGDITYHSNKSFNFDSQKVGGNVTFDEITQGIEASRNPLGFIVRQVQRLLRLLLVGVIAVWLAPAFLGLAGQVLSDRPWPSLGWGALTIFILFPVFLGLWILISFLIRFSVPLYAVLLSGFTFTFVYLGAIIVGLSLGKVIMQRLRPEQEAGILLETIAGLVAIWLITAIPFVGLVANIVIALFGVGSITLLAWNRLQGEGLATAPAAGSA